ncbi:Metallo-dependent protein [Balamuthia mandrillaris]
MGNAVYSSQRTRVFACSDLHVDHKTNWKHLCKTLKAEDFTADDVLIVAGDISTKLCYVKETLQFLCQVFRTVCYCPGNNELRLCKSDAKELGNGRPFRDSLEKFHHVLALCEELGVHTSPVQVNDVWIVPLFCWYTPSFDPKWDGSLHYKRGWLDFRACRWPEEHELKDDHDSISSHFLSLNDKHLSSLSAKEPQQQKVVITFSHFLPRFELLPPRWLIRNKSLPLVVGDARLDQQIRQLGARVHVFGHTHIDKDVTIDGVRYVQVRYVLFLFLLCLFAAKEVLIADGSRMHLAIRENGRVLQDSFQERTNQKWFFAVPTKQMSKKNKEKRKKEKTKTKKKAMTTVILKIL